MLSRYQTTVTGLQRHQSELVVSMFMDERALRKLVRLVLEDVTRSSVTTKQFLQMVDNGPFHSMDVSKMTPEEVETAEVLCMRGLLRRMRANGHLPERFVLTSGGSHTTDTFVMDTFHDEEPSIRAARRTGTLKTKMW